MLFLLYKLRNAFLVTNDLSGADLVHAAIYITITYSLYSNYEGYTRVTKGTLRKGTRG